MLDQFGRHIKRGQPRESLASSDARALRCSETLHAKGWGFRLSVPEHVFALMPMRHTPTLARLDVLLKEVRAEEALLPLSPKQHTQSQSRHGPAELSAVATV